MRARRAKEMTAGTNEDFPWTPVVDPASGDVYFYHRDTGDVTWEEPAVLTAHKLERAKQWVRLFDPETRSPYFLNTTTHEWQWERPAGYVGIELVGVMIIQFSVFGVFGVCGVKYWTYVNTLRNKGFTVKA